MCDMRGYPQEVINLETGERFTPKRVGHIGWYNAPEFTGEAGFYCVGATGVGYNYYDGSNWYSAYSDWLWDKERPPEYTKYDFVWPEKCNEWGNWTGGDIMWGSDGVPTGMEIQHLDYKFPIEGDYTESIYYHGCCRQYNPKSLPNNDLV